MVSITLYGGVGEVGGNKILVNNKGCRLFLDFGTSFSKINKFSKDPFLKLNFLSKMVMGILPDIEGVYNPLLLKKAGKPTHKEPSVDYCIITHSHMDHFGDVAYLDPRIKILCSKETYASIKAYENVTKNSEERQWTYHQPPAKLDKQIPIGLYYVDENGKAHRADKNNATHKRIIHQYILPPEEEKRKFTIGEKFRVDNLEIELYPVDHSIFDAHAILIRTPDVKIAYTGDIRFHGRKGCESIKFVESAKDADILITEGTKIKEDINFTTYDVEKHTEDVVKNVDGLIVVDFPSKSIEDILMYKKIAEGAGRQFVLPQRVALFLLDGKPSKRQKQEKREYSMFDLLENCFSLLKSKIYVYEESPAPRTRSRGNSRGKTVKDYPYKESVEIISDEEIRKRSEEFMVHLSFYDLDKLVDFRPPQGSILISNTPEPFDEESTIDESKIESWCSYFKLKHYRIHASGHLGWSDLLWMVDEIKPKYIIPVHAAEENAMFIKERFGNRVKILSEGQTFSLNQSIEDYF